MPRVRTFAYNSGTGVTGTTQVGYIAAGATADSYGAGLTWWKGPDEDLGYVICHTSGARTAGQNEYVVASPTIGFFRTNDFTDNSFIVLAQCISKEYGTPQTFANGNAASTWLTSNGYWNSWIILSGLIMQLDANNSTSYPGSGATVYDLTNSYNHTLIGATFTTLSGIKCFDCTTGNNRVDVNGTGPTLPTTGYTYITWARLINNNSGFRTLLYTKGPPKITPITIPNGTSTLGYWATAFVSSGYDVSSSAGVWVQYTVVGDNSSQTFYINGSQVGSTINEGSGGNTHWGVGNNDIVAQPFGHVANLYLYNRKLSATEIAQNYTALKSRFV